jgi:c-di-GMP-specific phosphodiesterase
MTNTGENSDSPEHSILFPALGQSMMAVVLIDEDDRVQFFNGAAEQLWGYSREDVLGHNVSILVPREMKAQHSSFIHHNRKGGTDRVVGMNRELELERRDGSRIWASFALSRAGVDGKIYYLAMARDVTLEVQRQEENRRLLMAMAHTDQPVIVLSDSSMVVQVNRAFTSLYGYDETDVVGRNPAELLSPENDARNNSLFQQLLNATSRLVEEVVTRPRQGDNIWVRVSAMPVGDGNRVLTFTDITENQKIRALEKEILSTLVSNRTFEETGEVICWQVESAMPGSSASLYHQHQGRQQLWARGDDDRVLVCSGRSQMWPIMTGEHKVAGTLVVTCDEQGIGERFTERVADVCTHFCSLALEQEARRQQLEQLKQFDMLTGLPNRRRLHQHLDQLLETHQTRKLAVFCLSIDRFRPLNEMHGYAIADQLLLVMTERLQQALLPGQYLGRTEGIQFVLIAPGCDADRASAFAAELESSMKEPVHIGDNTFRLTLSIGISLYPEGDRDTLLTSARHAMERIREGGGNGWQFFEPEVNNRIREEHKMADALKKAIAEEMLTLHYQPQVHADSGELYGVEALARWTDPTFGPVSPLRFIGIADNIGETGNLGNWVLKEACRQLAEWRQQGLDIPSVSVNLSPKNFRESDLPKRIAELLCQYALPGKCLAVEMTESDMMEMSDTMLKRLGKIRSLGVGLSVDDFGTGFSGLQNLARLPVTEIKIDKSFVDHMINDKRTRALTEAMIGIGQSLELNIVAEGVETQAQLEFLQELQCPVIQGYLFSPPLPPEGLRDWILKRK